MKNFLLKILTIIFALTLCLGIFTACGEPETPAHTHDYKTLKYDTENHWYECECGEKTNLVVHNLVNNTCLCGYEKIEQHVHDYKTLKYDTENHWLECECGEKTNLVVHNLVNNTCLCGYEKIEQHVHDYKTLKYDTENHWHECECGEKQSVEKHNYTELKFDVDSHWYECSCGAYETKENHIPGTEATETTDQKCTECQYVIAPTLGHVHTLHLTKVDAKPQSCTKEGNKEYYTCSCGKWFTNNTATTEITDKNSVIIEKDAHEYETLKYDTENHWYECSCGAYETKENHIPGTEATETTDQKCTECQYVIAPALGHVHTLHLTKVDAKPQSCTATGNTEYYTCSCGKWFTDNTATTEITDKNSVVIEKDAHEYETLKYDTENHWHECGCGEKQSVEKHKGGTATCTEKASCEVCKEKYGELGECNYVNNICTVCGAKQPSEGLVYEPITIGGVEGLCVSDIGTCTDTEVVIANKYLNKPVLSIGDGAFRDCDSLTSVEIPNSVTSIGNRAFSDCTSLTSIVIPNSVTSIGDAAFYNCTSLTSIVIPNSVTSIGDAAFYNCSSLTSVVIPNSVTSIGNYAFVGCTSLTSIVIPNSVTSIGDEAFANCDSLEYNISDGLKYLGNSENQYLYLVGVVDRNITTATIKNNCKVIGSRAFNECTSLTSIKVDENNANYKSIDGNLYSKDGKTLIQCAIDKTSTSFDIPNSVTSIGDWAFYKCTSLTSIVIPNSVTSIGDWAFYHCTSLTSIVIPNSVTSIGDWMFFWCTSLTSVVIPNSVTSIGDEAFRGCTSLTSIKVDENNANYKSIDGNLYSKDGKTLIQYAIGKTSTSFDIPNSVTSIGNYAFYACRSLTSIVIPNSVTSIGDRAFANCTSLTSIVIPNSVTSIGDRAFYYCSSLTIYCKAESKPISWSSGWNSSDRPVVWGYVGN